MSVHVYAAGHRGEGICLGLTLGPYRILLDCGLAGLDPYLGLSPPADWVVCSHAHGDHARALLDLHRAFPDLPIYSSQPTVRLLPLQWPQETDIGIEAWCTGVSWRTPLDLGPDLTLELLPAGHLPGAAMTRLTYRRPERAYSVLYTSDFLLANTRLVEGVRLEELRGFHPDVLIVEGSQGTRRHARRRQLENQLAERIAWALSQRQGVILAVPPVGLGQEVLMLLRSHHLFTGREVQIWVDGQVAAACDVYVELLPHLPAAVQNFARHQSLFWDDRVKPRVERWPAGRPWLPDQPPSILITDAPLDWDSWFEMDPAEVLMPWLVLLPDRPAGQTWDFPFYQSPGAAEALEGLMALDRIQMETYILPQHSDGPATVQLIHTLRPQHVVFVHGDPLYLGDLAGLEELHSRYQVHVPSANHDLPLPVDQPFLHSSPPETTATFEGEVVETGTGVVVNLPATLLGDPRWQMLGDTGLVEARWQGEELVLRGLSQREALEQQYSGGQPPDRRCCANCVFSRGQRCGNPDSPMRGLRVAPEGFCSGFVFR
ncbi:MAG: MBL fold metallo-hydrolase [Gloeomargaritaceae cyanobacterium C42_A2020_066]|nr:MBL fold metallo-hydrolase [Gloeomargaritaceae cyanobacterium C42_A2020_066]